MNYREAMKALLNGEKLTKAVWNNNTYIVMKDEGLFWNNGEEYFMSHTSDAWKISPKVYTPPVNYSVELFIKGDVKPSFDACSRSDYVFGRDVAEWTANPHYAAPRSMKQYRVTVEEIIHGNT